MWLVLAALRRPLSVVLAALSLLVLSGLALRRAPADIFPDLGVPVIYVVQPCGGMSPSQMESQIVTFYEYHFLYLAGIEHIESQSIQGMALLKLYFHTGTNIPQAMAQVTAMSFRATSFMPPGTLPPFIVRFDAGSIPVGQLTFSSPQRGESELQDLALFRVRPLLSTLPGVSAPPPSGGKVRTIVVSLDPAQLRAYRTSPDEIAAAVARGNVTLPAGNVRMGDFTLLATSNAMVQKPADLETLPIRTGTGPQVLLRDVARIEDAADVVYNLALVNGQRTVYMPLTKRADASTLDVVAAIKGALPNMRAQVPPDVDIRLEFDQSVIVTNTLKNLLSEAALGALLTGCLVLLFLQNVRSALMVLVTIPLSLLSAAVALRLCGQTLNIMTLGGLSLSVGILVDESTVAIENIHTHLHTPMSENDSVSQIVVSAMQEVTLPRFLSLLCVLAVFVPSFFLVGMGRALLPPLSLAVGFAMIASYVLSSTVVPVLASWLLRRKQTLHSTVSNGLFAGFVAKYSRATFFFLRHRTLLLLVVAAASGAGLLLSERIGVELFPRVNQGELRLRIRAPDGTRLERTEELVRNVDQAIRKELGEQAVRLTLGNLGNPAWTYPVNGVYVFNAGPHEALLLVALTDNQGLDVHRLEERLRRRLVEQFPSVRFSFEPGDLVSQVLNFGSPTPILVHVTGQHGNETRAMAEKLRSALQSLSSLRDVQIPIALDYPTLEVQLDRERVGQLGTSIDRITRSLVIATSSSALIAPNFWVNPANGVPYRIALRIPESQMAHPDDLRSLPVMADASTPTTIGDVATVREGKAVGEVDHWNSLRTIPITANLANRDLAKAAQEVEKEIAKLGKPPRGVTVSLRGQAEQLRLTISGLREGVLLSALCIVLLLSMNFQSFREPLMILLLLSTTISGSLFMLWLTNTTLNVQSVMGIIMSLGVSVAMAVLLLSFARQRRQQGDSREDAVQRAAISRLRPILMTSLAMIVGMIPMAVGFGEGGEQSAPLGRAVLGGLMAATATTLFVLPSLYTVFAHKGPWKSVSLLPAEVRTGLPLGLLFIPLLVPLAGCPANTPTAETVSASRLAEPQVKLETVQVEAHLIQAETVLQGELFPHQSVSLFARVPGFVERITVDRGSAVKAGQVILTLQAPELGAQRTEAEAKAQGDELTLKRLLVAASTPGSVSKQELDQADAVFRATSARALALRAQEQYLVLSAPFDGVVTERNVHPGALVGPPTSPSALPPVRIEHIARLRLTVFVPEAYAHSIPQGAQLSFSVRAFPNDRFSAPLSRVAHSLDSKTRTMPIELDVNNTDGKLAPGMFAQVVWPVVRKTPSLLVPVSAVVKSTERTFVDRIHEGTVEQVPVRLGLTQGGKVEVFGDLQKGDLILVRGREDLPAGSHVETKPQSETKPKEG